MTSAGWALLCEIGFWGWILSTAGMILTTFTTVKHMNRKSAARWGTGVLLFYAVWIFGMVNA